MFLGKKYPPCPGNPEDYVFVKTKEGEFWRRKRGTVKPAVLNSAWQASSEATRIVAPAAKRVINALRPYLHGIYTGRLNTRIGKAFRKSLKEGKGLSLEYLKGLELQDHHPLDRTVTGLLKIVKGPDSVRLEILTGKGSVVALNPLVTDYWFEAVILYGDAGEEGGLRTGSVESQLYAYKDGNEGLCVLELDVPEKGDWCVLLKMSSLEGNEMAIHPRHYRMKVVEGRG
jgi:hypothetical protein